MRSVSKIVNAFLGLSNDCRKGKRTFASDSEKKIRNQIKQIDAKG